MRKEGEEREGKEREVRKEGEERKGKERERKEGKGRDGTREKKGGIGGGGGGKEDLHRRRGFRWQHP